MPSRAGHPRWRSLLRHFTWLLIFTAFTAYKTEPLIGHMQERILGDAGDPFLVMSFLEWNYATLFASGDVAAYRDLPIFHPHDNVLTWSENLLGYAILGWPVHILNGHPAVTYNFLILLTIVLNGWAMCWLAYERTRRMLPSILAGLALYTSHYFLCQIGHVHCLPIFWGLLALLAAHRWERSRSLLSAFLSGVCVALLLLTGANIGAFFVLIYAVFMLVLFARRGGWSQPRRWLGLATSALPVFLVYVLVFRAYGETHRLMGHSRDLNEIRTYAARPKNLVAPFESPSIWIGKRDSYSVIGEPSSIVISTVPALMALLCGGLLLRRGMKRNVPPSRLALAWLILFPISLVAAYNWRDGPGFMLVLAGYPYRFSLAMILATALGMGACIGITMELMRNARLSRPVGLYLWLTLLSLILSFGPSIRRHHHDMLVAPYGVLLAFLSPLQGIRVPSRFGVITAVGLAMMVALGVDAFRRRRAVYFSLAFLVTAGLFAEWRTWHYPLAPFPDRSDLTQAAEWVARAEPGAAVLHLPLPPERDGRMAFYETPRMLFTQSAALLGMKTFNGYSGYFGQLYNNWIMDHLRGNWTSSEVEDAARLGVRYVLLDRSLPEAMSYGLDKLVQLNCVHEDGDISVYELPTAPPPERVPAEYIWALGAEVTARGGWDPAKAGVDIELPAPAAKTYLFVDRYLGDLILDRDDEAPMVCGRIYLNSAFIAQADSQLTAIIVLTRLPLSTRSVSDLDPHFRLRKPGEKLVFPVAPSAS